MAGALPATPCDVSPPRLLGVPALLVRPAALGVSAEGPFPQAPLASNGESTASNVRGFV